MLPQLLPWSILVQVALIGTVLWLVYRGLVGRDNKQARSSTETELVEVKERLAATEQRLTDVQDVMIALSEKFDRWEEYSEQKRGRDD